MAVEDSRLISIIRCYPLLLSLYEEYKVFMKSLAYFGGFF